MVFGVTPESLVSRGPGVQGQRKGPLRDQSRSRRGEVEGGTSDVLRQMTGRLGV